MSPALADPLEEIQSVAGVTREARAAEGIVSDDETVLLIVRPSAWFIVATSMNAVPAAGAAGAALALASLDESIPWDYRGALFASMAIIFARAAWQAVDWFLRLYILTDRRIVVRHGAVPEVSECLLGEVAGIGQARRWIESAAGTGSLAVMHGPSKRSRRVKRLRQPSAPEPRREGPRVRVDHRLEWSVIRQSVEVRRTILAAVARYR